MKGKKGLLIGLIAVSFLALAGMITGIVVVKKNSDNSYRVIKVQSSDGRSYVVRGELEDLETYEGMVLQSGDRIVVDGNSTLVLLLDEDKICHIEENTELLISADGDSNNSKTKIELLKGAFSVAVLNKLSNNSSFEVTTPNSTMAIRGTAVRSEVYFDNDNRCFSKYSLFKGDIEISSLGATGVITETFDLSAGDEIIIGGTGNGKIRKIEFKELPKSAIEGLLSIFDDEKVDIISKSDLNDLLKGKSEKDHYIVEFIYDNKVFATQEVKNKEKIVPPTILPSDEGEWFADLTKEVDRDLKIYWR